VDSTIRSAGSKLGSGDVETLKIRTAQAKDALLVNNERQFTSNAKVRFFDQDIKMKGFIYAPFLSNSLVRQGFYLVLADSTLMLRRERKANREIFKTGQSLFAEFKLLESQLAEAKGENPVTVDMPPLWRRDP
jgi:hypothetical protein